MARAIPSILYVRSRIRLDRDQPNGRPLVLCAHVVALVLVAALIRTSVLPWLALIPFCVLLARAVVGLSEHRRRFSIRTIGLTEMGYGILTVLSLAIGYWASMA